MADPRRPVAFRHRPPGARRLVIIVVLVASMLATLLVRLYYVQLLDPHKPVQTAGQLHDGDVVIPAGRRVMLLYASGNHDERQFGPTAGELDVTRAPRNILTFGHGAHHCLGAAAARMQSRVALSELVARIPRFEIDEDRVVWADGGYVRRPLSIPVQVT